MKESINKKAKKPSSDNLNSENSLQFNNNSVEKATNSESNQGNNSSVMDNLRNLLVGMVGVPADVEPKDTKTNNNGTNEASQVDSAIKDNKLSSIPKVNENDNLAKMSSTELLFSMFSKSTSTPKINETTSTELNKREITGFPLLTTIPEFVIRP